MADYYVDPSLGTDTGAGTLGDPWGYTGNEIQKALDNITQGSTGDAIHVKDTGTVSFGGTNLSFATYGTTTEDKPLTISGYTSAAWDGGRGVIDLGGASTFVASTVDGIVFADLDISGGTGTYQILADQYTLVFRCKINGGAATGGIAIGALSNAAGNYVYNLSGVGIEAGGASSFASRNYVIQASSSNGINITGAAHGNLIVISNTGSFCRAIFASGNAIVVINNSVYSTVAATAGAISLGSGSEGCVVLNNYVEGYSGSGGRAYDLVSGSVATLFSGNRWYNSTTGGPTAGTVCVSIDNAATSASGFTNAGSADYTPTSELQGAGFPSGFLGLSGNAQSIDIGAIQKVVSAGGGLSFINARRNSLIGR